MEKKIKKRKEKKERKEKERGEKMGISGRETLVSRQTDNLDRFDIRSTCSSFVSFPLPSFLFFFVLVSWILLILFSSFHVPFTLGLLSNQRYKKKGGLTALNRCLVENQVSIGFDDSSIRESHFFFFTSWSMYEMVENYLKSKKLEKYIDILDTCWYFL